MKKGLVLCIVLIAMLGVSACGGPAPTSTPTIPAPTSTPAPTASPSAQVLKVGFIGALSGAAAAWGLAAQRGCQMAAESINAAGGIVASGKRYTLDLIFEDDQYLGPPALAAANKLVFQDQVKFIVGPFGATPLFAIQPITEPNKVIVITVAVDPKVPSPANPFTFRIGQNVKWQGEITYDYMKKNRPEVKTVALMGPDDASGQAVSEYEAQGAELNGIKVVTREAFDRATTDFTPILTRILTKNPDMIDVGGSAVGSVGLIIKQARGLGFNGPINSPFLTTIDTMIQVAGPAAAENFFTADPDPYSPLMTQEFARARDLYVSRYGPPFGSLTVFFHDMQYAIKAGIEKAGSLDTTKVKEAMESPDFVAPSLYGALKFGYADQYGIAHGAVVPQFLTRCISGKADMVARYVPKELEAYMPK